LSATIIALILLFTIVNSAIFLYVLRLAIGTFHFYHLKTRNCIFPLA